MNLYSKKQRRKLFLVLIALLIVGGTILYASHIAAKVQNEERQKVQLWIKAIQKKADLVKITNQAFSALAEEERKKIQIWGKAMSELNKDLEDYSFALDMMRMNSTFPILLTDENDNITASTNLDNYPKDSLQTFIKLWKHDNPPIVIHYSGNKSQKIYYRNSDNYYNLQFKRDSLITSFNVDLVDNVALVPVLFIDEESSSVLASNLADEILSNRTLLENHIKVMLQEVGDPIIVNLQEDKRGLIYYQESLTLKQLRYFPYIMLAIIALFLVVGYLSFSTFRKAEQNQVWVGMAKETAHQLGTPLSSLLAWLEILKSQGVDESCLVEMNKDLVRLETITDRFSKIGSENKGVSTNVHDAVEAAVGYLKMRISKKVKFEIECADKSAEALLNISLFEWVIENLSKNAVDAMEGKGEIIYHIKKIEKAVQIDVSDNGKGIPPSKVKTVFEPGFTTKKRGWGLGLSLVKRIVEEHHNGKIFVAHSELGVGTTFRIILPSQEN